MTKENTGDSEMNRESISIFQNDLLKWYGQNARILPWRDQPSAYRVWISEVMLQQTRVNAVKPYFERFMKECPSIQHLAHVPEDKLLKLWEGLGYYNRAKNLKRAAQIVEKKFGGRLPSDIKSLQSLPGIGPYTAGAISSIAFEQKVSAVDGNVLRVMSRILANKEDITNPAVKKKIEKIVDNLLPEKRVGDFNQALMELGATICMPNGAPKCKDCPLKCICQGYQQGIAQTLPIKVKKKKRKIEEKTIFLLIHGEEIAIRQRPSKGLLSNMWEFPNLEGHLSYQECEEKIKQWGMDAKKIIPLNPSKHIFTHREWHMIGYFILIDHKSEDFKGTWATKEEIEKEYSIPSAFKDYVKFLFQQQRESSQLSFFHHEIQDHRSDSVES